MCWAHPFQTNRRIQVNWIYGLAAAHVVPAYNGRGHCKSCMCWTRIGRHPHHHTLVLVAEALVLEGAKSTTPMKATPSRRGEFIWWYDFAIRDESFDSNSIVSTIDMELFQEFYHILIKFELVSIWSGDRPFALHIFCTSICALEMGFYFSLYPLFIEAFNYWKFSPTQIVSNS